MPKLNKEDISFEEGLSRFLKVYANIPMNLRREIILVINDEPITWNTAYVEIKNKTKFREKNTFKINRIKFYIIW